MQELLSRIRAADGSILWLMHVSADPDCVGSCFALREAFGGVVGAPTGMNKAGDALVRSLGLEVDTFPHPENHKLVIAVDTGSRSQLGRLAPRLPAPLIIDHHRYGDLHEGAPAKAWDPARASCAEVVLSLLDAAGVAPSQEAARGLLAGLVTDTARFRHADAHAFTTAARLTTLSGVKLEDVYALFEAEEGEDDPTLDLRRASLVAVGRAQITEMSGFLVGVSHIGSFDAAAASALVRAGADVALVGKEKSDDARLSARASSRVRGLHLGELMNDVARSIGWSGGGHEGAAGMRGDPPLSRAQDALLDALELRLATLVAASKESP